MQYFGAKFIKYYDYFINTVVTDGREQDKDPLYCFTLLFTWHVVDVSCFVGPSMISGICMESIHIRFFIKFWRVPP